MAGLIKKGRAILGIDINPSEIRVVEIQGAWPTPEILRASYVETPQGAFVGAEVARPELISKALRGLLNRMETGCAAAVIGIPSGFVATRVLDIPQVPHEEILAVVKGEIVHQRILPNPNGEFDYLALQTGDLRRQARPRLLLMAAESRYPAAYAAIAQQAGLTLAAIEPGLMSMYRALSPIAYERSPSLCLMIGSSVSEVAIMDQGPIRLYRRIDIGCNQLLTDIVSLGEIDTTSLGESEIDSLEEPGGLNEFSTVAEPHPVRLLTDAVESSPARSLLIELQRSMDYYHREYPEAPSVNSIVIAYGRQDLTPLLSWLSNTLHIATVPAAVASYATIADAGLRQTMESADGFRYVRAAGMAMRGLDQLPSTVPHLDLLRHDKDEARIPRFRSYVIAVLGVSILLMLVSCLNAIRLTNKVSTAQTRLSQDMADSRSLQTYRGLAIDEVRRQKSIRDVIQSPGVPLPAIVDTASACLPDDAAISDISTDAQGLVNISGEAAVDTALVRFLDALRQQADFARVSLDKLERTSTSPSLTGLHYEISVRLR